MATLPHSVTLNRRRLLTVVPPFRPVAVQLLRLIDGPSQDLARIGALLRSDAVMAAGLMRAANSPLFRSRYEIASPLQALVYLGLERVKALVATTAMKALADATHSGFTYACWRHNLATALICQKLSASANLPSERCYIGGLIHDIGRLALLAVFPEYEHLELLATERDLFGLDHAQAGCWLLSQWGCPIEMQNVAAFHHNPAAAPKFDRAVVSLVHLGSHLADQMGMSVFPSARRSHLADAGVVPSLDIAGIAEWVAIRVNGMEASLV